MKKSKFTEAQIVFAIKQFETGTRVDEISRQMGISQATFFNWKKMYGSTGVLELCKLQQLQEENHQLKKLVADLSLDKQMFQNVIKKVIKPTNKKEMDFWMVDQYQISQTRACQCVLLAIFMFFY